MREEEKKKPIHLRKLDTKEEEEPVPHITSEQLKIFEQNIFDLTY